MSDTWVISDTHFNHANILTFTDRTTGEYVRKFDNVKQMNECMIDNWNSVVKQGDKVYHLGDVFFGPKDDFKSIWPKLNGSKSLIVGNHDDIKFLSAGGFFKSVYMWRIFREHKLLMSHVPIHESELEWIAGGGVLNVHGHIHQNPTPSGPYRNVSVEVIDYTPINIEELSKSRGYAVSKPELEDEPVFDEYEMKLLLSKFDDVPLKETEELRLKDKLFRMGMGLE